MFRLTLLIVMFSLSPLFHVNKADDDEGKPIAICKSTPKILDGYVVIAEDAVYECRTSHIIDNGKNTWWIKKPAEEQVVCEGSPMPGNYVVASKLKIESCPNGHPLIQGTNAWLIRRVEQPK